MTALPGLIVTGASGFVGRHVLDALKDHYRIFGMARRSQAESGAPVHPNITWWQVDIGERQPLEQAFAQMRARGDARVLLHLAAHYDFSGEEHPEYFRTNVEGLRNVLELSAGLGLERFVFSSSVAACRLPPPGHVLDETSPPDGQHIYARSKRIGEQMLQEYRARVPSTVVRFAALFSDWCEYPPLFMFLETWLSRAWNRNLLAGRGDSAIPYLHVEDLVMFLQRLLGRLDQVPPGELLIASPDGSVSHRELHETATLLWFGVRQAPAFVPKSLCLPGLHARDIAGRLLGERPFERPWMADYIDLQMNIDARRTRERLDWRPRPRLEILRRLPFLIEHRKTAPHEWNRANRAAMKQVHLHPNLRIFRLLKKHEDEIAREYTERLLGEEGARRFPSYQGLSVEEHAWNHRMVLSHLMSAVRTRERGLLMAYCDGLARRRFEQGYSSREVCGALEELNRICFKLLRRDPESNGLHRDMQDHITMTLRFGCDQAQHTFERLEAASEPRARETSAR
jgi:nucleoside-diphosphate-sugar epimerase